MGGLGELAEALKSEMQTKTIQLQKLARLPRSLNNFIYLIELGQNASKPPQPKSAKELNYLTKSH